MSIPTSLMSTIDMSPPPTQPKRVRRQTTRSKTGCYTCRLRRVKCDEVKPCCAQCSRRSLSCNWNRPPTERQMRRQQRIDAMNRGLAPLASAGDTTHLSPARRASDPVSPVEHEQDSARSHTTVDEERDVEDIPPIEQDPDAFIFPPDMAERICNTITVDYNLPTHTLPGTCDPAMWSYLLTIAPISSAAIFASLPAQDPVTDEDRQALGFYGAEVTFGFGSKSTSWSTHKLLGNMATNSPTLFHLLLAAASSEYAWQNGETWPRMLDNAERNYKIGMEWLLGTLLLDPDSDPLEVMSALWFLYIYQRRRPAKLRIAYAALSSLMADYISKSRIPELLSSGGNSGSRYTPKNTALLARLTTWLFWVDTQAGFQKEGGRMARLLAQSVSAKGVVAIFDVSTKALSLNYDDYPAQEVVDDMMNKNALKLIHRVWVIVYETTEAVDSSPTFSFDPVRNREIKAKIESLRNKPSVSPVFALTESKSRVRDRLIANSDWAVANFFALCIYHYRCSIQEEDTTQTQGVDDEISKTVDALLVLIQKSLATDDKGQSDRMQWPLFWAGIEVSGQFSQDWVLERLKNRGLHNALQIVLSEQQHGMRRRIGMARIREICMVCSDDDSGVVDMGIWAA